MEEAGIEEFMFRWFLKAATGHNGLLLWCVVRITVAPSSLVVFVDGMSKLAEEVPSCKMWKMILRNNKEEV